MKLVCDQRNQLKQFEIIVINLHFLSPQLEDYLTEELPQQRNQALEPHNLH